MTVLAILVAVLDIAQFVPHVAAAYRGLRRSLAGISATTWAIVTVQAVCWIVYGFDRRLWAVAIPNCAIAPMALTVLVLRSWPRASRSSS